MRNRNSLLLNDLSAAILRRSPAAVLPERHRLIWCQNANPATSRPYAAETLAATALTFGNLPNVPIFPPDC